jgi:hypothetical protein
MAKALQGLNANKEVHYEPKLLYGRETVLAHQNTWISGLVPADLPTRVAGGTWTLAGHVGEPGDD